MSFIIWKGAKCVYPLDAKLFYSNFTPRHYDGAEYWKSSFICKLKRHRVWTTRALGHGNYSCFEELFVRNLLQIPMTDSSNYSLYRVAVLCVIVLYMWMRQLFQNSQFLIPVTHWIIDHLMQRCSQVHFVDDKVPFVRCLQTLFGAFRQ